MAKAILHLGDCLEVLRLIPGNSVDAIVTDPPAGIGFMGKEWDDFRRSRNARDVGRENLFGRISQSGPEYARRSREEFIDFMTGVMQECLRVLKPGGHALVWAIPRTSHWTATAIEDAGFEIRDRIVHIFGSGFPKSLNVSKAIDKAAGAEREVISEGKPVKRMIPSHDQNQHGSWIKDNGRELIPAETIPATPAATEFDGWGTSLKPAAEDWWLARKPLCGTVAINAVKHGTGGLNIDACRIDFVDATARGAEQHDESNQKTRDGEESANRRYTKNGGTNFAATPGPRGGDVRGRWPANVVLDDEAGIVLDEVTGNRRGMSGGGATTFNSNKKTGNESIPNFNRKPSAPFVRGDNGGPSRFFYCAKASRSDRGEGNKHPTVKNTRLMRWLIRLITPPGGLVLDPFMGSGSTGVAAVRDGFQFVGIEKNAEYFKVCQDRIAREEGSSPPDAARG